MFRKKCYRNCFFDFQPEGLNSGGYMVQPDGVRLRRQNVGVKNIYKVPVDKKFRGKIWKAEFGHAGFYLMNIPHVLSLTPFRYDEP